MQLNFWDGFEWNEIVFKSPWGKCALHFITVAVGCVIKKSIVYLSCVLKGITICHKFSHSNLTHTILLSETLPLTVTPHQATTFVSKQMTFPIAFLIGIEGSFRNASTFCQSRQNMEHARSWQAALDGDVSIKCSKMECFIPPMFLFILYGSLRESLAEFYQLLNRMSAGLGHASRICCRFFAYTTDLHPRLLKMIRWMYLYRKLRI